MNATSIANRDGSPTDASAARCPADDRDGTLQRRKQSAQPNEKQPISGRKPGPLGGLAPKHVQLMPQHCDLGFQLRLRAEGRREDMNEQPEEVDHRQYPSPSRPLIQRVQRG